MNFQIDTNITSEARRGHRRESVVASSWSGVTEAELWLSPLVLGEVRKAMELACCRDSRWAELLVAWLADVMSGLCNRVPPIDAAIAERCSHCRARGRTSAIRPAPVIDSLLVATAKVGGSTHAMRDVGRVDSDFLDTLEA